MIAQSCYLSVSRRYVVTIPVTSLIDQVQACVNWRENNTEDIYQLGKAGHSGTCKIGEKA